MSENVQLQSILMYQFDVDDDDDDDDDDDKSE